MKILKELNFSLDFEGIVNSNQSLVQGASIYIDRLAPCTNAK